MTWWELPRYLSYVTLSTLLHLSELVSFLHKIGTMIAVWQSSLRGRGDVCKERNTWLVLRK